MPVLLFLSTLAGWSLLFTQRLSRRLRCAEWLTASGALTLLAACWVPFGAARVVGMERSVWAAVAVAALLMLGERLLWPRNFRRVIRRLGAASARARGRRARWIVLGLLGFVFFHLAGHIHHCLREHNGAWWSAGAGWEDQSFHTALATSFAYGDNLNRLTYPHVAGWPLGYPFLPDFQAGWFHVAGISLPWAFVVGNTLASATLLLGAWTLLRRWLDSSGRAFLGLLLWHLGGGAGVAFLFDERRRMSSWSEAFVAHDYANDWGLELHFHNVVTGVVWPMRVVLFGLAVAIAVALLIRNWVARRGTSWKPMALAGGMAGMLPLVGAHALVVLACVTVPLVLMNRAWSRWRGWLAAMIVGAVFTLPQLAWMSRQLGRSDPPFIRWMPGWMAGWGGPAPLWPWLTHWAWNTGVWVTLGAAATLLAGRRWWRETAGWWLILLVGQLFVFQPYVFDNVKLFAAATLAAGAGCAWLVARGWGAGGWRRWTAVALLPLMTGSGVQSIVSEALLPAVVVDAEGRVFAETVRRHTPPEALILTGSALHHPVLVLSGRPVLAANPSGMTLHGVPRMVDRVAECARIYRGEPDARELLRSHHVAWIVDGPMERGEHPGLDEAFLREVADEVAVSPGGWRLLRVKAEVLR